MEYPKTLDILENLLAIDTTNPPGNEQAAAEYLQRVLAPFGFATALQRVAPGRANLAAVLVGDKAGPHIMLSGHLDVVAADAAQWGSPPFSMHTDNGNVYGRGACDMKGAISAMVSAACAFSAQRQQMAGSLTLAFVADEEIYGAGTRRLLEDTPPPDSVIIGEPTNMDVCVAHRGAARYRVEFAGKSGHAGMPQNAVNPLYYAARFCLAAERHNQKLAQKTHPVLPPPTIAVTILSGGEQGNSIPGSCTVTVDRRTHPEETGAFLRQEALDLLRESGLEPPFPKPDFFVEIPAGQPLAGSKLGGRCQNVLNKLGHCAAVRDFGACCDQYAFTTNGIDCVLVGPGSLRQAHTSNEYVPLAQLELAESFYTKWLEENLLPQ